MNFVIHTPPYTQSSQGVRVLHELSDDINSIGFDCIVIPIGAKYSPLDPDTIAIYPEVISGNPLKASRIVRYFLNREGYCGGVSVNASPKDYLLAYLPIYHPAPHGLLTKLFQIPIDLTIPFQNRSLDATYIGKGSLYRSDCFVIPGSIEVTRNFPSSKSEYYDLLKKIRYFYTWDVCSATVADAIFLGAIPIFLYEHPYRIEEFESFGKIPRGSFSIQKNTVLPSTPENFEEIRNTYVSNYFRLMAEYKSNLRKVISDIRVHFDRIS